MPRDPLPDMEIAAFLEGLPPNLTFTAMEARVRHLFGAERAWPLKRIRGYFGAGGAGERHGKRSRVARDPEMAAFVRDRTNRLTLDELLDACRTAFPDRRLPSRSALHRFLMRDRGSAAAPPAKARRTPNKSV